MKELKKEASHKLLQSRASKHLLNDCLELEAYIRSNTAHDKLVKWGGAQNSDVRQNIRY